MASAPKTLLAAPFHHLEPLLAARVRRLGGGDPLAHRRVVVISNRLRDHVQRVLARAGGFAGVSVLAMLDLAREVADTPVGSLASMSPVVAEVLAEQVLEDARGELAFFRSAARGYGRSLYATLTDLSEANLSPDALEKLARDTSGADAARCADLALLARRFEGAMFARNACDGPLLFRMACEEAEAAPPCVPTIFYGFAEMNALQCRLVAAVSRRAEVHALVPARPEAPACAHAVPLLERFQEMGFVREQVRDCEARPLSAVADALFSRGMRAEPPPEGALRIVLTSSPGREAREVCREMFAARAEAKGADALCVLTTDGNRYQTLFEETCAVLDAPCRTEEPGALSAAPAGRLFLLMLDLKARGYPRAGLMRFLGEGGFARSATFREMTRAHGLENLAEGSLLASRWEFFSRELPYVRGRAAWLAALSSACGELQEEDEEYPVAYSLAVALPEVFGLLEKIPEHAAPSVFAGAAAEAFGATTCDVQGSKQVEELLFSLVHLDDILAEVTHEEFCALCERFLEKTPVRDAERGTAHLASLSSMQGARGFSFDTVAVAGMTEGVFPPRGAEDPLLPDALREEINRAAARVFGEGVATLPLKKIREREARFQLWTILQSVRGRLILSTPGLDEDSAREDASFPSPFFDYLAETLEGSAERVLAPLARSAGAPANYVHTLEYDLARIEEQIEKPEAGSLAYLNAFPGFARRRAALAARWREGVLTAHDGLFASPDLRDAILARVRPPAEAIGVTSLEGFFGCPYRFLYARLYPRMKRREEPAPPLAADGLLRGELAHAVLEALHRRLLEAGCGFQEMDESTLSGALEQAIRTVMHEKTQQTGAPLLLSLPWEALAGELRRRLLDYLKSRRAQGAGWQPVCVEERFGTEAALPMCIPLEGGEISLAGKIDLLERGAQGAYRVVDFKTLGGKGNVPSKNELLSGGARLQLHLYARHLLREGHLPADARVGGVYVYLTEEGTIERARAHEELEEERGRVDALLGDFLALVGGGMFFPTPSDACRYCDYKALCGPDRNERFERKKTALEAGRLIALREAAP